MSIIPRAKVKELPFAFAEDLKGGRAGRSAKKNRREREKERLREREIERNCEKGWREERDRR